MKPMFPDHPCRGCELYRDGCEEYCRFLEQYYLQHGKVGAAD